MIIRCGWGGKLPADSWLRADDSCKFAFKYPQPLFLLGNPSRILVLAFASKTIDQALIRVLEALMPVPRLYVVPLLFILRVC